MNLAKDFGGNAVRSIEATTPGLHMFAEGPYTYYLIVNEGTNEISVPDLLSYSVFVLSKGADTKLNLLDSNQELQVGDAVQVEEASPTFIVDGYARLLVAGTTRSSGKSPSVTVTLAEDVYKVVKPWGHELWINGQHPNYALKEISINCGTKTSLQYHRYKQETNILFNGEARLSYKKNEQLPNDEVGESDLGYLDLQAVSAIDVTPMVIHRLEALSEVLLYEVSTPHLDDVIRIIDDTSRSDGRIEKEHEK